MSPETSYTFIGHLLDEVITQGKSDSGQTDPGKFIQAAKAPVDLIENLFTLRDLQLAGL